jgi:hypothetical protein
MVSRREASGGSGSWDAWKGLVVDMCCRTLSGFAIELVINVHVSVVAVLTRMSQLNCQLSLLGLARGTARAMWHLLLTQLVTWALVDHDRLSAHFCQL